MSARTSLAIALAAVALASQPAAAAFDVTSDPILYWNKKAVTLFVANPALQTRGMAMANIAMHDAANSILGQPSNSYLSGITGSGGDVRAAVAQAAHDVLVQVNPGNAAQYGAALAESLAAIPDSAAKTNGRATGAAYAAAIISNRAADGSTNPGGVTYTSTNAPGDYRVPGGGNAALPFWGNVTPFMSNTTSAVSIGPPPALGSAEYAAAYNEVKAIGSLNSLTRTADQTSSALFWDISNGTTWVDAALVIAEDEGLSTLQYASIFGKLTTSLADALIAGFDAKYDYRLWRPITAIQLGDTDGNPLTAGDANWTSLFASPAHPSYVSNHSMLSAAAAAILLDAFGEEAFSFTIGADTRSFSGIAQAAQDAANSRLWGGIHFRFDNEVGLASGAFIGRQVLAGRTFAAVPEPTGWALMIAGFGMVGWSLRRRRRTVMPALA